jgi:hypothetical protein
MQNETPVFTTKWNDENIVGLIRKVRNDLIKDFLDERVLKDYINKEMGVKELSQVKSEFIKNGLKEMLISPVDTHHYQPVIQQIRETDTASLSEKNEGLFYQEINVLLKTYLY